MEQTIYLRNTGITVLDVLKALERGYTSSQVLAQFNQITMADILASIQLATNLLEQYVTTDGLVRIEGAITLTAKNSRLINVSKLRETLPRAYEPWAANELNALTQMYKQGEPLAAIAVSLGRGEGAIRARLEKMGLLTGRGSQAET